MFSETFYDDVFYLCAYVVVWLLPLLIGAWYFERKR